MKNIKDIDFDKLDPTTFDEMDASFEVDEEYNEYARNGHVFIAEESGWYGHWIQVGGNKYQINYKKNGAILTADIHLQYGWVRTANGLVRSINASRYNSSDRNSGLYFLAHDPTWPGMRMWSGWFDGQVEKVRAVLLD